MVSRQVRVTQVSFVGDERGRSGRELLSAWPTLPAVARAVNAAGANTTVVIPAAGTETLQEDGVTYQFISASGAPRLTSDSVSSIIAAVVASKPEVVHVQGLNTPRAVLPLTRALRRTPILIQDHGGAMPTGLKRLAHRWAYSRVSGAVFTAAAQSTPWKKAGVLPQRLPVFEAVEMSSVFTPGDQGQAQAATGMFGSPCLLWTGRLDANKDPFTVLAAVEQLAESLPDVRLWCCHGDAPLLQRVSERIASSEWLQSRVAILGTRPHAELELRYRAADFFVQASHREGSGYSVIEALACGSTPVVTDIPSFRRIVGDAGSLTPLGDSRAMAEALLRLWVESPAVRRARARAQFERRLSFQLVGEELMHAYREVLAS